MIEGRGFAERPRETPPAGPGSVVPSPLQSSCRVCSWPGMEMDFAVLGGLQGEKNNTFISRQKINEHKASVVFSLAHSDQIKLIDFRETWSPQQQTRQRN